MKNQSTMSNLLELTVPERILTVQYLWDSITEFPESVSLTDAQKKELDRRLESFQKNPKQGISWEKIKSNLLSKHV